MRHADALDSVSKVSLNSAVCVPGVRVVVGVGNAGCVALGAVVGVWVAVDSAVSVALCVGLAVAMGVGVCVASGVCVAVSTATGVGVCVASIRVAFIAGIGPCSGSMK